VKRLYRLIIVSFLGPFVMTFFIVLFILLMQFLWRYIDELVGKGLEFKVIGELLMYAASSLIPLALPLAVLLASLMTFGNLGEFYELTAIKSSGISLRRVMMPLVILIFLVSIGAFFFANNVLPFTNLKMKSLLYDVRQQRPEVQITAGVFYNGIENYSIRVDRKDPVTNLMYNIKIYDHSAHRGNIKVTVADSGQMKMTADRRNMVITLWNGFTYNEMDEGRRKKTKGYYPHETDKFGEQRIIIEMTGFEFMRSDESLFRNSYTMLNISQLKNNVDSLQHELDFKATEFRRTLVRDHYFKLNQSKQNTLDTRVPQLYFNNPALPVTPGSRSRAVPANVPPSAGKATTSEAMANRFREKETAAQKPAIQTTDNKVKPDSGIIQKSVLRINNFDSLFNSYSLEQRHNYMRTAINYVMTTQYLVGSVTSNLDFVTKFLRRHEIELHRKFTLSFACLIFLFIGAPLGAIIRKGGLGMPAVISTLLFIVYYILSMTGEKFVRESVLTPFQGMWLSSWILVVAGIFLTYQATNDSAIMNIDTYLNWLREKAGLRKGILLEKKSHIIGRFELIEIPKEKLQEGFTTISDMAKQCVESLKTDSRWKVLINKAFTNTGFFYLIEFGIHYNSFIDQVILSSWFRIPYFNKRLTEFPLINGRTAYPSLRNKLLLWMNIIIFPLGIYRLLKLRFTVLHIRRNLKKVIELSAGMVNLLNSSALKMDIEYAL
jgi:lipopolysaccharide export system permease protein